MIVILGCGILGRHLLRELDRTDESILAVNRSGRPDGFTCGETVRYLACDLTADDAFDTLASVCGRTPLNVFYLAASHNIDAVFADPVSAKHVNLDALQRFLTSGFSIRRLLFASTDCVYGENRPEHRAFFEDDALHPLNEYGRQKAAAECIVLQHGFTVARLPFLFGTDPGGRETFSNRTARLLRQGQCVDMIDGMIRSALSYPTAARLLVQTAACSDAATRAQVYNVCADRGYSKYEIGCMLADVIGCERSLVRKITMADGEKFFRDRRAYSAVMDNTKLKQLLSIPEIRLQMEQEEHI